MLLNLLRPFRWLLLPLIPTIFFLIFLITLMGGNSPQNSNQKPSPTQTQNISQTPSSSSETNGNDGLDPESPEFHPYKKNLLSDGSTIYYYKSGNESHPNVGIYSSKKDVIFSNRVASNEYKTPLLSVYKQAYGEPERIVNGSKTYGENASTLIYPSLGIALIVDISSGYVYEEQYFPPMSADNYLQKYGNLN